MNKCSKCKQIKENNKFSKNTKAKNGLQRYCKECFTLLSRTKYKDSRLKSSRKNYISNKTNFIKNIYIYQKNRDSGLYRTYLSMRRRCKYPSQVKYKYYGGKGIRVEWLSYNEFKNDMYGSFLEHIKIHGKRQTTIDRIDSDKNYCKENCRWATYSIQNKKR